MIELTSNAATQLLALVREKGLDAEKAGLCLGVEKGGCAGLQYAMTIGSPGADDQCIERDGARLYVAADSVAQLDGSIVDYDNGLAGAGFRIRNPKASRSCGCGTSFEPTQNSQG